MEEEGKGILFVCFCQNFLLIHLFSYRGVALQSSAGGSRQETSCQVRNRLATNPTSKISIGLLEISFRAHPSSYPQLFIVGLLFYLSKGLDSLWRGDTPVVSPDLQMELCATGISVIRPIRKIASN